jgi:hypothetical protein
MRWWLAVTMMSLCGLYSAVSAELMWWAARAEHAWLAVGVYGQQPPAGTPTPFPVPAPVLAAGMRARVQTLPGEFLNMRAAPSLGAEVLALLKDGTFLLLVGEPVQAEGYVWWPVEVSHRRGWVAEQVGDTQMIVTLGE